MNKIGFTQNEYDEVNFVMPITEEHYTDEGFLEYCEIEKLTEYLNRDRYKIFRTHMDMERPQLFLTMFEIPDANVKSFGYIGDGALSSDEELKWFNESVKIVPEIKQKLETYFKRPISINQYSAFTY